MFIIKQRATLAAVIALATLASAAPARSEDATVYAVMMCRFIEPPIGPRTSCHIMSMSGRQLIFNSGESCEAKATELRTAFGRVGLDPASTDAKIGCMSKTEPLWTPVR